LLKPLLEHRRQNTTDVKIIRALEKELRHLDIVTGMLNTSLPFYQHFQDIFLAMDQEGVVFDYGWIDSRGNEVDLLSFLQNSALALESGIKPAIPDPIHDAKTANSTASDLVGNVMKTLEGDVEDLEDTIRTDAFDAGKRSGKLETVVKIKNGPLKDADSTGEDDVGARDTSDTEADGNVLIDAENNRYVLSRANDPTKHHEDDKLFHDLVHLLSFALVAGFVFERLYDSISDCC
jgi:hypothetical protein